MLRNLGFANNSRLNFAELAKACPGNIAPTDVDGAIEFKGHFFFIEGKRGSAGVPRGQAIFYEQLIRKLRGKSIVVFFGHDSSGQTVCPVRDCVMTRTMVWSEENQKPLLSTSAFKRHVGHELVDWLKWVSLVNQSDNMDENTSSHE